MALWLPVSCGVAFIATWLITPRVARLMLAKGFRGRDLHKQSKAVLPEQGGLAAVGGFFAGLVIYATGAFAIELIFSALSALAVAAIGFYDRIRRLSAKEKAVSLTLAGIPLIFIAEPTISGVNLGIFYFLALPVLFMFTCNFTNMLAGLNGLEVGVGAIASFGIAGVAFLRGEELSMIMALILALSLLAFLRYNFYPARVFPGDVCTLFIGALLFSSAIVGKFELLALVVLLPYVIDAALKLVSAGVMVRESQEPTIAKEGKLYPPENSNLSLIRAVLRIKPLSEREVVLVIYAIAIFFSLSAIALESVL